MSPRDAGGRDRVRVETPERYEEIVLVGHSEGGVALRQAVAEVVRLQNIHGAANMAPHQLALLSARLCLFAPAIAGAGPSGLKSAD
jgi:predicted alpha/beta hydrolase family esterase